MRIAVVAAAMCGCFAACGAPQPGDPSYEQSVETWRAEREERLRSESGWLTLVGLHWLAEGENRFGSDAVNEIVLPADAAPALAGLLLREGDRITLRAAADSDVAIGGEPVGERVLTDDSAGEPDVVNLGRLSFFVIRRGERFALRVKDPQAPARRDFQGVDVFPIDVRWRVDARFERYDVPAEREIADVTGDSSVMFAPGLLHFEIDGRELTLEPLVGDPAQTELFLIFRDETSGDETYGAGRYLYADLEGERAVLDFNRAYNPPCVFTPYATCPLPPPQNRLAVAIRAGEKDYGHS